MGLARPVLAASLLGAVCCTAHATPDEARAWLAKMSEALATREYDGLFTHSNRRQSESMRIVHRMEGERSVERLVSLNLVERRPAPNDRRAMIVTLTPEGRRTFRSLARTHEDWIADIFAGLEPGEVDTLMKLLAKTKTSARNAIDAEASK